MATLYGVCIGAHEDAQVIVRLAHVPALAPEISTSYAIPYSGGIEDKVSGPEGAHILTAELVPPTVSDGDEHD